MAWVRGVRGKVFSLVMNMKPKQVMRVQKIVAVQLNVQGWRMRYLISAKRNAGMIKR